MALDALIFDFDGVLVDSNDSHVRAWNEALQRCGYKVEPDRLFVEMGKGGDRLVPDILGKKAEEERGDELRQAHAQAVLKIWRAEGVRPFPGAERLLADLRARGLCVALATSSDSDQVAAAEEASGVAWRKLFDQVTTGSDVQKTKPSPDLVVASTQALKMSPAQCAMVGDTPWDARAAAAAGVVAIGISGGGNAPEVLRAAGARIVYRDVADLGANLQGALMAASPGSAHLGAPLLDRLLASARNAAGGQPVGCVVTDGSAEILSAFGGACDRTDPTAHPPLQALRVAGPRLNAPGARAGAILAVTHEPCPMCLGAAVEMGIDVVLFAHPAAPDHGTGRLRPPAGPSWLLPRIVRR